MKLCTDDGQTVALTTAEGRMVQAIVARRKGGTHWAGCEQVHIGCAAERIAQLETALVRGEAANTRLRERLAVLDAALKAIDAETHVSTPDLHRICYLVVDAVSVRLDTPATSTE